MSLFLITFFFLYGCMHAYIYFMLRPLIAAGYKRRLFAFFLCVMIVVPVCVRISERKGFADLSAVIAWGGYLWMGFAFILIVCLGLFDLGVIILRLRQIYGGDRLRDERRMQGLKITLAAAFLFTSYGFCEALMIRTEHLTMRSPKIPSHVARIRIVQLSDVHLGVIIGKWRLKRMIDKVHAEAPDILVATGDIVDGQMHRRSGLSGILRGVSPRYGSFAVLGNHEFYVGLENSVEFLRESGFRVLRKESVAIFPFLRIAGVDDTAAQRWGNVAGSDERGLLPNGIERPYTILLKHRPAIDPESAGKFDIQLSGHVHKGQIFPFNVLTYVSFPVKSGINKLSDGSILYVSRGTGTWGPPIRFLAPPEITVIDILPEKSS